jgi:RNA-splicing ligase RtcB
MIRTKDYRVFDSIGYEKLLENEFEINQSLNDYFNAMMAGQAFADFDKAYIVQEYVHSAQVATNVWSTEKIREDWELQLVYYNHINHSMNQESIVDELRNITPKNEIILFVTIDNENQINYFTNRGLK